MSAFLNSGPTCNRDKQWKTMIERLQRKNSGLPSSSLHESRIAPSTIDITQHTGNSLTSQQFYGGSNSNISQFPAEANANAPSNPVPSLFSSESEFRMPQTTKEFNAWRENKSTIDQCMNGLRNIDKNGQTLIRRLVVHSMLILTENQTANPPASPPVVLDQIYNFVKENYYGINYIPKSLSGSSVMSDGSINFHQQPIVVLSRNLPLHSTSNLEMAQTSCFGRAPSVNSTTTSASLRQTKAPSHRPQADMGYLLEESRECLFNNSILQHQRDEQAARQQQPSLPAQSFAVPKTNSARAKPTPKPKLNASKATKTPVHTKNGDISSALKGKNQNVDVSTLLPAGIKCMTRTGRLIKSPVQFYKVANESTVNNCSFDKRTKQARQGDFINSILNDSMTLRNNKVVDKKITPPSKSGKISKKNTPLSPLLEKDSHKNVKKKPAAKKASNRENKENMNASQNKATKNKKEESVRQVKEKAPKKASKKRTAAGDNETISKKKKIEEVQHQNLFDEDLDSEDEMLGITYRKTTHSTLRAVSPSTGLLSVKKAAAGAVCKETPPCKTMGTMINTTGHSTEKSASAVMEVPLTKPTQVVKRISKTMQKKQKKTNAKPSKGKKGDKKEEPDLKKMMADAVKSSYPTTTPTTAIKYSEVIFGEKLAAEDSDFDSSNDRDSDDDLL